MRLLLISDTHANYAALEAVMADAQTRGFDKAIHLGDALGYGPNPREVLRSLRELGAQCVRGNHDDMAARLHQGEQVLPSIVSDTIRWQLTQLDEADMQWVASWPDGIEDAELGATYRHGSPLSLHTYTDSVAAARESFAGWEGRLGFVGHTHLSAVYATLNAPVGEWVKHQAFVHGGSYPVPPSARVILNPGSVGQPRDGNPQASYATFDTQRQQFKVYRVDYDIAKTQADIERAGLSEVLGARLALGK